MTTTRPFDTHPSTESPDGPPASPQRRRALLFDYTVGLAVGGTTVLTLAIVPRSGGSLPNIAALPEGAAALVMANELA